ncbi:hypothetical protein BT96DRAFT_301859 [Gymnopus androsaceus JB14]|uniref:Uncharacterized protein n=1 Tax=Gymnopus androsaceus JB14 TaxID=1447944 RepID=A0A6A4H2Q6_9AGAR|nr:hypothetical protein BT96DRAFT_301859 [Gymnopus androsaceus JB14]
MLGVNVTGGPGLVGYNSGWELWGPGSPSQRNPASASDIPSSQTDPGYRGTIRESWSSSSRPASSMQDEDATQSSHLKDFSQPHEAQQAPLNLHHPRQRQGSAAPFSAPRPDNHPAKLSPPGYDHNINRESGPRYNSSSAFVSAPYSASHPQQQHSPTGVSGYESLISPAVEDPSLRYRGMAVEDDYAARQRNNLPPPMPPNVMQRPQHPMPLPRPSYSNNYTPFAEYPYGYEHRPLDPATAYRPPAHTYSNIPPQGLVPAPSNDVHHQSNAFYDFGHPRPPSISILLHRRTSPARHNVSPSLHLPWFFLNFPFFPLRWIRSANFRIISICNSNSLWLRL